MSIEGQGHFFTIYFFHVLYVLCFTRPRYQVSVYRTIGPLVCVFYSGQIRTLVAMASYSSHRLIMGKMEMDNFCQVIRDI